MKSSKSKFLLVSLALSTWPMSAMAQQASPVTTSGEVEVGIGWVTEDSFKFGEYTGLEESGAYFVGNIEYLRRSPYDGDSTTYFEFQGNNLGLDSRSVYVEGGRQGRFSVYGEYDAIPHLRFDDGQTPYSGAGSTILSLPPGWVPGGDTSGLTNLTASLQGLEIETERERIGAGFSLNLNPSWTLSTAFRSEEKTGIDTIAGIFGSTGGNMRAAVLPRPVDYTTHQAELAVGYSTDRLQADIRYNLSLFDNNKDSLTWDNPYTANAAWDPSQDFNNGGQGRMALEPNNSAHNLSVSLGYMLSEQTRLAGTVSLGRMIQDDDFLPYTVNPNLTDSTGLNPPLALPRSSLDGEVNTIHATLGVTTRLTQNADLKAAYTYDNRDNQTPVDTYLTIPNDSIDQGTTADARARRNRPYSIQTHKVELEAGYRLTEDTKLTAEYEFEAVNRDLQEVDDTTEHTLGAKVRSSLTQTLSGSFSYAFSTRSGSTYDTTLPYLVSHDPDYLTNTATLPDDAYEQNPYLRKYYMADRQQHLIKGGLTYFPSDRLVLGLNGSYRLANYDDSVLGLTDSSYGSATIDASYTASRRVSLSGFLTYDMMESVQVGWQRPGFVTILPTTPVDTASLWEETITDQGITAGFEVAWSAIEDSLDIVLDYAYSNIETEFKFATQLAGVLPPPDLTSELHSVGIRGDYQLREGMIVRLGYRYETLEVEDFALANVDEVIAPAAFALGNGEPEYDAHVVAGSLVISF